MQNLQNELINILQHEDALVVDGQLNKNKIVEMALQVDPQLIKHLIKHDTFKTHFFTDVEGVLVFDKIKFQRFVNNKSFLPDSYTAFKNKIGLTINDGTTDNYITTKNDVVLAWPHKDCVLEGGQTKEDQKRNEIFWNETLAPDEIDRLLDPKVFTNWKKYDQQGEHEVTEISDNDNLIIKGNNLLALASLKKRYAGKVKLIYIDPPYNTGSDGFNYNDNFNHSTWLTFMRNRLLYAKLLLKNSGFIFVQCDDNEQAYLKVLMDEVFGTDNHRSNIYIETVYPDKTLKQDRVFHDQIEHVLIYAKSNESKIKQTYDVYDYDKFCWKIKETKAPQKVIELGGKRVELFNENSYKIEKIEPSESGLKEVWASGTILDMNSSGRFFRDNLMGRFSEDGYKMLYKVFDIGDDGSDYRYFTGPKKVGATKGKYYQGVPSNKKDLQDNNIKKISIENFWAMAGDFGNCRTEGRVEFKSGKKPEKLLHRIMEMTTEPEDLVLDFFVGSGTTLAVCHKMGRQYIGIEQLDYDKNDSLERMKNVIGIIETKQGELMPSNSFDQSGISKSVNWQGGGSLIYCELAKYNQTYADQILEADSKEKLIEVWQEMKEKAFLSYQFDKQSFDERIDAFKTLSLDDQKKFLLEVLDKNQLYVNFSEMADETFGISEADKKLNKQFYNIL